MYPFSRQQISPATGKSLEIGAIFMIDQSLIMSNPMNCSPGSSVHGIFQESILQWVAISSFRESSQPRNWIHICFVRWILYHCTTCDLQGCANKSLTTSSLKKLSFACFVFFFFSFQLLWGKNASQLISNYPYSVTDLWVGKKSTISLHRPRVVVV